MTELERALRSVENAKILVSELEQEMLLATMTLARRTKLLREICPHINTGRGIYGDEICSDCGKNLT